MARGAGTTTRGRLVPEASSTMWQMENLLSIALLARVLLRSRKKLPFDAPKVGLPVESRTRAESPEHHLTGTV